MKEWRKTLFGREMMFQHGKVAKQSAGSIWARFGDSIVLATVNVSDNTVEGIDFVPLTVEFMEKFYAAGKIPGGFVKRENKPSESGILSSRLIDRPIRPLFPKDLRNEVQVIVTVLSVDPDCPTDVLGIAAASLALNISKIPFDGIAAGVQVGYVDGEFVVFPTTEQLERSKIDIVVAGTKDAITMVEGEAKEVTEEEMLKALMTAHAAIKEIVAFEEEILAEFSVEKMPLPAPKYDVELVEKFAQYVDLNELEKRVFIRGKQERSEMADDYYESIVEKFFEENGITEEQREEYEIPLKEKYDDLSKSLMRKIIVERGMRADGRGPKDIRPITCEVGLLPRAHGSSLFTRGETQSLGIVTLGSQSEEQIIDTLIEEGTKRFILHYNFPPFSTGEVKPLRGPGRREIGHGHLAERAVKAIIPSEDEFPYVIRVVSEILESNGSSSMATVCSASLALMDAGVPVKKHVAGVAMGLIVEGDKGVVLTDILGLEDHWGDMDFKVAGTKDGITAFQMDCKVSGVSEELLRTALIQAREARAFILGKLYETISEPRKTLSPYAPRISWFYIDPAKSGELIGPGGRNIKGITKMFNVDISLNDENGKVTVSGVDAEKVEEAVEYIKNMFKDVSIGDVYNGKVTRVENYGIFVEIAPGKSALVHSSKLGNVKPNSFKIGDRVKVEVTNIDEAGRLQCRRVE
ncbi:MAG TPA: polyribonucleotide nucleotidyltransferase [Fervidobacterium sp.]|jgi:polyribonucleotide nucleotidyltransferase|nr:polyribonucleotide nucleotidyltransferase [Fervidobacterium sp.]MBP8657119.1 polyribonucleotide nucleotidyltransferase [Fervidobacterium sp.]MBP9518421.1 polyribonucleotide nucleotidyltransferase [Fervidobacterium sp.]HCL98930.1 polyribonucleotide nucleotidyltransferase [Fervidobacterium sp.]HOK33823.1 polyribonucleotide nucleotidyltransferase [Fervidobacterium sp.]